MIAFDWEDNSDFFGLPVAEQTAVLKTAVTMTDVAELCGYDVDRSGKIRPPWNRIERTPSTHIYEDHYFDYGSGRYGDVFDFLGEIELAEGAPAPSSLGKRISMLRKLALKGGKEPGDVEVVPVRKVEQMSNWLPAGKVGYEPMVGLDLSPFDVRISAEGDLWVPHRTTEPGADIVFGTNDVVYGVKIRRRTGEKSAVPGSQFTYKLYSPTGWSRSGGNRAVICEGESDSWAMWHAVRGLNIDVYALPSGAASWKDAWLEDLKPYQEVLLCFDNDRAGKQALDKATRKVGFDRAKELRVPGLYNDAREALAAGWVPRL